MTIAYGAPFSTLGRVVMIGTPSAVNACWTTPFFQYPQSGRGDWNIELRRRRRSSSASFSTLNRVVVIGTSLLWLSRSYSKTFSTLNRVVVIGTDTMKRLNAAHETFSTLNRVVVIGTNQLTPPWQADENFQYPQSGRGDWNMGSSPQYPNSKTLSVPSIGSW